MKDLHICCFDTTHGTLCTTVVVLLLGEPVTDLRKVEPAVWVCSWVHSQ